VPHRRLGGPRSNPSFADQRPERVPQGANVQGPAPVIILGNAREAQVTVEDLAQLVRHVEQRGSGRQPDRDRGASLTGFLLQPGKLVGQPLPQVRGEIVADRDFVALPVLFVGGV
jgi:hypothetical protein